MLDVRSFFKSTIPALLWAETAISCPASYETVFVCDLVAMSQRVELCQLSNADGERIKTSYSFGTPGETPELQFSTQDIWGNWNFEGHVEMSGLSGWNIGAVHPNGTVYAVYAYGRYDDNIIRRSVLQVYPSIDDFNNARGAIFHAECDPGTIHSDDFAEYFRP